MADNIFSIKKNQLAPNEFDYNKLLPSNLIQKKIIPSSFVKKSLGSPNTSQSIEQPIQEFATPPVAQPEIQPEIPSQVEQDNSRFLASLLGQGVAMFGAGIAGRDPMRAGEIISDQRAYQERLNQQQKIQKEQKDLADNLMSPASKQSERKRLLYSRALGIDIPSDVSASDLEDPVVLNSLKQQSIQAQMAKMPKQVGVAQPKVDKEKKNPYQKEINFINIYSKNGLQALDELKKLIQSKGTSELLGASGTKIDQYIRDIAIAKTKILDPNSVISQGEIDSVKKTLGLDDYTRPFISSKTAIESLDNFKNILINNRNNAINILESLPSEESFNEKEKFIIESYRNNPDDPDTKRAYDNMLKSKGR